MSAVIVAADRRRFVTPEPLNVAPALVGQPLATPARRALAMGLDLVVVALLSGVSGFWLAGGLALVVLQLRSGRGGGTRPRRLVGWLLVALLAALAFNEAWTAWRAPPGAAKSAAAAKDDEDDEEGPRAAASALKQAGLSDAERIALLEHALAQARKPRKLTLHDGIHELTEAIGASFGWGIVYFSLLPALWQGQTIGKKVLRLRIVELTGKPMTVMRCLKRYGGYAAGMATGGLGFTQLIWDDNRQAIQDRAAHTVVIDLRAPPAA